MKSQNPTNHSSSPDDLSHSYEANDIVDQYIYESASDQARQLAAYDPKYHRRYVECREDVMKFKTVASLVRLGQQGRGYKEEYTSWLGMRDRSKILKVPLSLELARFKNFLLHLGPKHRYDRSNRLTLDKIDNEIGYLIGNVRWATLRQQTENRRVSRFNIVEGRHISDRQLSTLFANAGKPVTYDTIKKRRQRMEKKGVAPENIAREQFRMARVPYKFDTDPVIDWYFPWQYAKEMEAQYRLFQRGHEPRIEFFIRTLEREMKRLNAILVDIHKIDPDTEQKAMRLTSLYAEALMHAKAQLAVLKSASLLRSLRPLVSEEVLLLPPSPPTVALLDGDPLHDQL